MKVTKRTAAITAIMGVCVFATTAFASYTTGNGYDKLKKAIKATKDYTNCTINTVGMYAIDGKDYMTITSYEFDAKNKMLYSITQDSAGVRNEEYYNGGKSYNKSAQDETFTVYDNTLFKENLWGIGADDEKKYKKAIEFFEVGLDTIIGDLKNNIICTGRNDEYTSYSLSLDYMQIPELVQTGIATVGSLKVMRNNIIEPSIYNVQYMLSEKPVVSNLEMAYTINKDGTLRDGGYHVKFTGTDKNGEKRTAEVVFNIEFSNVGTTVVTPVDVSGTLESEA